MFHAFYGDDGRFNVSDPEMLVRARFGTTKLLLLQAPAFSLRVYIL